MMLKLISWIRRASFFRTKLILFSILVTGVLFDVFIKLDFKQMEFEYGSNSTSLVVLLALVICCLVLVFLDFWYEKIKSKERTDKELIKAIRSSEVSSKLKVEIIKFLIEK